MEDGDPLLGASFLSTPAKLKNDEAAFSEKGTRPCIQMMALQLLSPRLLLLLQRK